MTSPFDGVPEIYHRVRPQYPPPLFDALFHLLPADRVPRVVEIGPGTGQATGPLLARGAIVTAVEAGPQLAAFLARTYRAQPNLTVVHGRFEDVSLAEGAWDLVVAATAFHWVAPEARITRPHLLLAANGVLAVIDTIQVRSAVDRDFFERAQHIYTRYWPKQRWTRAAEPDVVPPIAEEIRASDRFDDVGVQRFRWDQVYGPDEYADLVRSYSNTYELEPEQREALIGDLRAFVAAEDGGFVVRPLVITLTTARRK